MICYCCGQPPDGKDTTPRFCEPCRDACNVVATARISRGPLCPLVQRSVRPHHPAVYALRPMGDPNDTFVWRGRVRRNIPGG